MVNQKLFTMKQPELGKKISEMRKAKGLTQEELVELCNLNVRTIQRIEAGEVTPRSYTIKALFEALGIQLDEKINVPSENVSTLPESFKKLLYLCFGAGLLYMISSIVEFPMDYSIFEGNKDIDLNLYFGLKLASLIFFSGFMLAFYKIADFFNNFMLKIAAWIMILVNAAGVSVEVYFAMIEDLPNFLFIIPYVISTGAVFIIFGISFLQFKSPLKSIAVPIGVLGIVTGVLFVTVIGAVLGIITQLVFEIGLLYFLFWFVNKSGRSSSPDSSFTAELQS
ncbi:helix-turn-helix domain-containing protein [Algoriphagus aquimarinus]|nr:helix-turn-helix transcriptional regulator [Algoriphagus aquimarinus]